jgi:hypothetical protein
MASERQAARCESGDPTPVSNVCDDRVVTVTELKPAAQYFPPMRPPESARGHVASQPKVDVVPDCSSRIRTARSLRRQSSVPPAMRKAIGFGHGWPLYLAVAGIACALAIGVVRNFARLSSDRAVKSTAQWATPHLEQTPERAGPATDQPSISSASQRDQQDSGLQVLKVPARPTSNAAEISNAPRKDGQPPTIGTGSSRTTGESPASHPKDPKDSASSKAKLVF